MKPFDLQKALAGEPVITRTGMKVTELIQMPLTKDVVYRTALNNILHAVTETGVRANYYPDQSNWDLFMAPKKREIWVNEYQIVTGNYWFGMGHQSEEGAKRSGQASKEFIKTHHLDWEE